MSAIQLNFMLSNIFIRPYHNIWAKQSKQGQQNVTIFVFVVMLVAFFKPSYYTIVDIWKQMYVFVISPS